jgi:hypothetical protein
MAQEKRMLRVADSFFQICAILMFSEPASLEDASFSLGCDLGSVGPFAGDGRGRCRQKQTFGRGAYAAHPSNALAEPPA